MKTPISPPGAAVARFKERLIHPWSSRREEAAAAPVPALKPLRALGFPARIAEFLLVFRLRVKRRSFLSADILERALRVVLVTCQSWFGAGAEHKPAPRRHD